MSPCVRRRLHAGQRRSPITITRGSTHTLSSTLLAPFSISSSGRASGSVAFAVFSSGAIMPCVPRAQRVYLAGQTERTHHPEGLGLQLVASKGSGSRAGARHHQVPSRRDAWSSAARRGGTRIGRASGAARWRDALLDWPEIIARRRHQARARARPEEKEIPRRAPEFARSHAPVRAARCSGTHAAHGHDS